MHTFTVYTYSYSVTTYFHSKEQVDFNFYLMSKILISIYVIILVQNTFEGKSQLKSWKPCMTVSILY